MTKPTRRKSRRKKSNNLLLIPLMAALVSVLSGCWDRTEINDLAIVLATAVDLEKDGQYRISIQVALPGQMGGPGGGGGGTSGSKSYYVDSDTGRTVREGDAKLQARMSRKIFLSHRRVLVIGEELARKKGVLALFDEFSRVPQNRLTTYMIVAKGKAYDLLNAKPNFERFSGEAMREMAKSRDVIPTNLKRIAQAINHAGSDAILPYMEVVSSQKGKEKTKEIQMAGYAQFRDGKMVGLLQGSEAKGVQWLLNKVRPHILTFDDKRNALSVRITQGNTKIVPYVEGDEVHFNVKAQAEAEVMENLGMQDLSKQENEQGLEKEISALIESGIRSAFDRIKAEKADSANLGIVTYWHHPRDWQDLLMKNWPDTLAKSTLSVHVDTRIRRIGLISENIAKKELHQ